VSRLSDVQFSRFTETEVGKLLTFGRPRGMLEVMVPMTDDERRDLETHIKEHFRLSMAIQVKACHVLYRHGPTSRLQKRFFVKRERLIEDPFFWYFFGFMDLETAVYRAPVFFVPSHVVHAEAVHQVRGNIIDFVVANRKNVSPDVARRYLKQGAVRVTVDLPILQKHGVRVILDSLLEEHGVIRHDSERLARLLLEEFLELR